MWMKDPFYDLVAEREAKQLGASSSRKRTMAEVREPKSDAAMDDTKYTLNVISRRLGIGTENPL